MGTSLGFLQHPRQEQPERPPTERRLDYAPIYLPMPSESVSVQAARCMDCGVPFCHSGCPLGNVIPAFNDRAHRGHWRAAIERLHATNNFPEWTGLVCPALCEDSCVVGLHGPPVAIKTIEYAIVEKAWEEGWIVPQPPARETGKSVAIVGSGPAGLAAAQQLRRAGHRVTVFERSDRIGGLLRYGIPRFKLGGPVLERRLAQISDEGVDFKAGVEVGSDRLHFVQLRRQFDAVILACGACRPRDLQLPGRELDGIHLAMSYLTQQTRILSGDTIDADERIDAMGKHVVVIGGGDTGADCMATAHRQGASSVVQLEILDRPPDRRLPNNPWPEWARVYRTSYALKEGGQQCFAVATKAFVGEQGRVRGLLCQRVRGPNDGEAGASRLIEVSEDEIEIPADLVLLALGFVGPEPDLAYQATVALDSRGNVSTDEQMATSVPGVFAAGDMRRGQSLVVWAIAEGRRVAASVDAYLA